MLTVNSTETAYGLPGRIRIIQTPRIAGVAPERSLKFTAIRAPLHHRQTLHYPHRRNFPRRVHLFMVWLTETIKEAAE